MEKKTRELEKEIYRINNVLAEIKKTVKKNLGFDPFPTYKTTREWWEEKKKILDGDDMDLKEEVEE